VVRCAGARAGRAAEFRDVGLNRSERGGGRSSLSWGRKDAMRYRRLWRVAAEFFVVILGVFLALAADRWNQRRSDAASESAYVSRLIDEIRADSIQMAGALDATPARLAARDSLMRMLNGDTTPPDLVATVLAAAGLQMDLNPPNAWRELEAASSLNLIHDTEVRQAVTTYYRVDREAADRRLTRAQERGRDPFYTTMYRLGLFELSPAGASTPTVSLADALAPQSDASVVAFREWPGMHQLLNALGGMYLFQAVAGSQLIGQAGRTLQVLEAARR